MATMSNDEFVQELERYRHDFYRYIHRNVWNASAAEDVFSNAVMSAFENLHKFEAGTNFRAWMYQILTNKCFVANREIQRSNINVDTIDESQFEIESKSEGQAFDDPKWFMEQIDDQVYSVLQQLSTNQRSCLLLLTLGRFSYKEIAAIMDIPLGTVVTHLARGRARLRRLLMKYATDKGILKSRPDVAQTQKSKAG